MQSLIAGVHFNLPAINHSNPPNRGPTRSQPVSLIHTNQLKYTRAPKLRTVSFLMVELLVGSLNGGDHEHSPWYPLRNGSMGCPAQARSTIMEMWRNLWEHILRSLPFCHHQLRAISTVPWSHYSGMYSSHTIELMLGGGSLTTDFVPPFRPSGPVWPSLWSHSCRSPIWWNQEEDSWCFVQRH